MISRHIWRQIAFMSLPIYQVLPDIQRALQTRTEAIVVAEPGAGKTTGIPLALLSCEWLGSKRILMLEPRRIAAKLAAQRMASVLGEEPGETVGYRMRLESRLSRRTRIEVVTEGVLLRLLQNDPSLEGYGLVIFDEFHERSVDADLGLALCRYARELFREDAPLKILVMSATLDSDRVSEYLGAAPVIRSQGRSFPVEVNYAERLERRDLIAGLHRQILHCLVQSDGSILVFLPGQGEILSLERALREAGIDGDVLIAPLYGALSLEQQQQAIRPPAEGKRKVVLATDIAESSLTIEGINTVIDSGWSRQPEFDARLGMSRLSTKRITRASAEQRAGRAGRLGPGIAWRMWSQEQHRELRAFDEPEILNTDLAPVALQLLAWGVSREELDWLDAPNPAAWQQALLLLQEMGACDDSGLITDHGEAMAALPAHPRLSHMLIRAAELGFLETASEIAALLSERDPASSRGADISRRLPLASLGKNHGIKRMLQQAQQLRQQLAHHAVAATTLSNQECIGACIALAYPDRIALQRSTGGTAYQLANGRGAVLAEEEGLRRERWLAVAHLGGAAGHSNDRIFLAAPLDPLLFGGVLPAPHAVDVLEWQANGQLLLERQQRVGKLIVERQAAAKADDNTIKRAVLQWLEEQGLDKLPWSAGLRAWQQRVLCLRALDLQSATQSDWPDVSDTWLQRHLEQWLLPFLPAITHLRHLQSIDLGAALKSLLEWPLPRLLDEQAPTHLTVPTGSRIAIDYSQSPPVLAVKLQEMFGQRETPRVAQGRLPLTLHLLSPAGRPLQVTQDLASFWANSYSEVKKDMKGRYPKHPWPDDPLTATPSRGTKKQGF